MQGRIVQNKWGMYKAQVKMWIFWLDMGHYVFGHGHAIHVTDYYKDFKKCERKLKAYLKDNKEVNKKDKVIKVYEV